MPIEDEATFTARMFAVACIAADKDSASYRFTAQRDDLLIYKDEEVIVTFRRVHPMPERLPVPDFATAGAYD